MGNFVQGRNESLGDGSRGTVSSKQLDKYNRVVYYGRVLAVSDDNNMKLKVFIRGVDANDATVGVTNNPSINDVVINPSVLPWCEPFLPRMFNVVPKVGESVKVLLMDTKNTLIEREWIGPVISQPEKIGEDPHFFTSLAGKVGGLMKLGRSIKTIPEADGIYPKEDDVSMLGRDNSDVL